MVFAIVSSAAIAQDDLDNLLKDLEGEAPKTEAKAEEKSKSEVEEKTEEKAEEKVEEKAEETESKAEEKAEKKVEEKAEETESKAEEKAEEKTEEKVEEKAEETESKSEEKAEEKAEEKKADEPVAKKEEAKPAANPDAELIENIRATEELRRRALDVQAKREIDQARIDMENEEYVEAVRHYGLAVKLLNDRPSSKDLRRECDLGIAEGLYRAALQEDKLGRRERAVKFIEKAIDMRHPKARRVLERWNAEEDPNDKKVDSSEFAHVQNDESYKLSREQIKKHLRRSRQYLSVRNMEKALEECEVVLVNDPYNEEAISLRGQIQGKRKVILKQEREVARDGMIADVDEAWRPVYAVNAANLKDTSAETVKTQTGEDPERTQEQDIERRMKEMTLPTISFKPPATIIDAVEFFRGASKDYDRPNIPVEQRGFNFVLKTPQGAIKQQAAEEQSDDFSSNETENPDATATGLPPIPTINASNLSFYDALKLVCDSVDYKFIVRGPVVMVMQKDMSTAEILSRKYNVPEAFMERVGQASEEIKTMGGFGNSNNSSRKSDDEGDNPERDWKAFFEEMGVKWPEGSSIKHVKALGKLYVRNTRENLAEFEKVLDELGGQPQLIEIETRFVEVEQADLNSLGFEWILNSDYSLDVGSKLGKALGVKEGVFPGGTAINQGHTVLPDGRVVPTSTSENTFGPNGPTPTQGAKWSRARNYQIGKETTSMVEQPIIDENGKQTGTEMVPVKTTTYSRYTSGQRNVGVNAFGGTASEYGNGNRYLSQTGNHISGSDASNNDQFMRVNAFLGAADLSMILHMLSQRSDTDLLSAPKVVTKSGENAVIKVVTEYIYPQDYDVQLQSSGSSSGSSSSGGSSQSAILAVVEPQNFTMREVGVILDVTPTYSEANGGTIDLELKPSVVDEPIWHNYGMKIPFTGNASNSSAVPDFGGIIDSMVNAVDKLGTKLTPEENSVIAGRVVDTSMNAINNLSNSGKDNMTWYDAPMEQPFFHVRSIDSKVSITPGSTVVMGGLITEARKAMDDKVPFLGDLPFIGRLFRSHAEQTTKRNLLIFVTGRLITPSGREISLNGESEAESEAEVKPAPKAE